MILVSRNQWPLQMPKQCLRHTAGAVVQAMVLRHLDALPMQTLFNLLGRGYGIVVTGLQFGGMLSHAVAAKLLLQVQAEIATARAMGINLGALSRTAGKVCMMQASAGSFGPITNNTLGCWYISLDGPSRSYAPSKLLYR